MVVQLAGELCIQRAQGLHGELVAHLAEAVRAGAPLALDLSQVSEIDSAGVQLLLHARQQLAQQGLALRLLRPAEAVLQTFALLGLAHHVGDPSVADPAA